MSLTIGGVTIPEACYLSLSAEVGRTSTGRKTLRINATGTREPTLAASGLSAVNWLLPVVVTWPAAQTLASQTLRVLSSGLQESSALAFGKHRVTWSLEGAEVEESGGVSGIVTIGGTNYFGVVSKDPIGGTIQRKTNGAGTLLKAWGKWGVRISGEGAAAPAVSGVVAVASTVYTGNLLVPGVSWSSNKETALIEWSMEGEQP